MEKGKLILTRLEYINFNSEYFFMCEDCKTQYTIKLSIKEKIEKDSLFVEILRNNPKALCNGFEIEHCPWCYEDKNKYYHVREVKYKDMGYNLKKLKERFINKGILDPKKIEKST